MFRKQLEGLWWWQQCIPRKTLQFLHSLKQTVFLALKLPQSCCIMNIRFPTHHIYPTLKTILAIWQNMKSRELQKSQFFNCLVNWEILRITKLIFKNPNFQTLPWIGKNWEVQLEQHSKVPIIDLFVSWEKPGNTA